MALFFRFAEACFQMLPHLDGLSLVKITGSTRLMAASWRPSNMFVEGLVGRAVELLPELPMGYYSALMRDFG